MCHRKDTVYRPGLQFSLYYVRDKGLFGMKIVNSKKLFSLAVGFILAGIASLPFGYAIIYKISASKNESLGATIGYRLSDRIGFSETLSRTAKNQILEKFYLTASELYNKSLVSLPETLFMHEPLAAFRINVRFAPENNICAGARLAQYREQASAMLWYRPDQFMPREDRLLHEGSQLLKAKVADQVFEKRTPKAILFISGDQEHPVSHVVCGDYVILKQDLMK